MAFWADGFWADGFWADGFWEGMSSGGSSGTRSSIVRITLSNKLVANRVAESSAFVMTVRFWDDDEDQWTADTPSTARYRIDNPDNDTQIVGWTTITPATSATILVTASQNAIVNNGSIKERRQMTVETNAGTDYQYQETKDWHVVNLAGQK